MRGCGWLTRTVDAPGNNSQAQPRPTYELQKPKHASAWRVLRISLWIWAYFFVNELQRALIVAHHVSVGRSASLCRHNVSSPTRVPCSNATRNISCCSLKYIVELFRRSICPRFRLPQATRWMLLHGIFFRRNPLKEWREVGLMGLIPRLVL